MKLHKNILALFTLTMMGTLSAADFQFQNVRVGGLGCPSELTQIVLTPDSSAASIIFSQFESRVPNTQAGPKVSRNINMLNCNVFLDIKIPAGVKLDALELSYDMRGFATFDRGVQGSFKSYLVSKTGLGTENLGRGAELVSEKNWMNSQASQEEDFTITSSKSVAIPSQCARGSASDVVSIRLQNTLSSQILGGFENQSEGSIIVDSSDIKGGLKLKAYTSFCGGGSQTRPTPERNCRTIRVNGRTQQVCI